MEDSDKVGLCFKQSGNTAEENSVSFILMISDKGTLKTADISIYEQLDVAITRRASTRMEMTHRVRHYLQKFHTEMKIPSQRGAVAEVK